MSGMEKYCNQDEVARDRIKLLCFLSDQDDGTKNIWV